VSETTPSPEDGKPVPPELPGDGSPAAIATAIDAAVTEEMVHQGVSPRSPEARRIRAERVRSAVQRGYARVAPQGRTLEVLKRVATGAWFDGFIHAGNLAYMALIALFPFMITATALMTAFGQTADGQHALEGLLQTLPPDVARPLTGPVAEVLAARTGPLLWVGGLVGLWTVGSLIETIRDILRRAYGTQFSRSFWHYRLYSIGLIVGAVMLLLMSVSAGVFLVGAQEVLVRLLPDQLDALFEIALSKLVTVALLYLSVYILFWTLTPGRYRKPCYPKWPGAAAATLWMVGVAVALPPLLASMVAYDLTYGSLAGVMVVLFFFYLIGFGVVIGAELNAALTESPEEEADRLGQADNARRPTAG
jgi:membrane protein